MRTQDVIAGILFVLIFGPLILMLVGAMWIMAYQMLKEMLQGCPCSMCQRKN